MEGAQNFTRQRREKKHQNKRNIMEGPISILGRRMAMTQASMEVGANVAGHGTHTKASEFKLWSSERDEELK